MDDYDYDRLYMKNDEVAKLSEADKIKRLEDLIKESYRIVDYAIDEYATKYNKGISCKCVLFSGGNDSTALLYLFKDVTDYVIHVNTGIGIEQTRDFVRSTCKKWNLNLKEYSPAPEHSYENLIKQRGFPGPGQHYLMYQRLKERSLRVAKKELNPLYRRNRIVYIAGRRRDESKRRMNISIINRDKSTVWASPLYNWTKTDIETLRMLNPDIPRNPVSDLIHMSGECLCGAFAHYGEREEIGFFFPEVIEYIESLEKKVSDLGIHDEKKCKWGWGATMPKKMNKNIGMLCSSCESQDENSTQFVTVNKPHKVVHNL